MPRYNKVLFFTEGMVPTDDEYKAMEGIGRGVMVRNASKIVPGAPLENCDAVAGAVPFDYAAIYGEQAGDNPRILLRPSPTRTAASGGADDLRPGTVDDGLAHESGTGSGYAGNPTQERARELRRTVDQRAGREPWEKNVNRAQTDENVEPRFGMNATVPGVPAMGAWPTKGNPATANTKADAAPPAVKEASERGQGSFAEAMEAAKESDQNKADYEQQQRSEQQQQQQGDWPGPEQTGSEQQPKEQPTKEKGKSK